MGEIATDQVKITVDGAVGVITMSDPATLNAASAEMLAGLRAGLAGLAADDGVRCIVLTGEGRAFCSGASLTGGGPVDGAGDIGEVLAATINPLMLAMRDCPKPLVAAVNGAAAGVGASFAIACDLVVAAESAYFLQAFRRIGLVPDGGATWMLPRLIGKARAMELMLLGDKLDARTALAWGLINRCVPDAELMPTTLELARNLAAGPLALGLTRRLVWEGMKADFESQLGAEVIAQRDAGYSADALEGIGAFLAKRPAVFRGR